jgi:hypothetical protein
VLLALSVSAHSYLHRVTASAVVETRNQEQVDILVVEFIEAVKGEARKMGFRLGLELAKIDPKIRVAAGKAKVSGKADYLAACKLR